MMQSFLQSFGFMFGSVGLIGFISGLFHLFYMHRQVKLEKSMGIERDFFKGYGISLFLFIPSIIMFLILGLPYPILIFGNLPHEVNAFIIILMILFSILITIYFLQIPVTDNDFGTIKSTFYIGKRKEDLNSLFLRNPENKSHEQLDRFRYAFDMTPYENYSKKILFRFKPDANMNTIKEIAKSYHDWTALLNFIRELPSTDKMAENEREKYKKLQDKADAWEKELRASAPILKEMFDYNVDAHLSLSEQKSLEKLRNTDIIPPAPKLFIHPTIESLHEIQFDPNVSNDRKREAKELEAIVRQKIEAEKSETNWTADEVAERNMDAVRMYFGMK